MDNPPAGTWAIASDLSDYWHYIAITLIAPGVEGISTTHEVESQQLQ
jgi:hypothetical protein